MFSHLTARDIARWRSKVGPANEHGCRDWLGRRDPNGYGRFDVTTKPKMLLAHRIAFWLSGRVTTDDKPLVCHRCNRPPCCEPTHLYADDNEGNMRYMAASRRSAATQHPERVPRGDDHWTRRQADRQARGEHRGSARLWPEAVRMIRRRAAAGVSYRVLAQAYGVSVGAIAHVVWRTTWRHVD